MEAKVVRWGDDLAVRLSADEVRALGLTEGQTVEVTAKPVSAQGVESRRFADGRPVYTLAEMVAEMKRLGPAYEPETVDWGPDRGSEIINDDDPR